MTIHRIDFYTGRKNNVGFLDLKQKKSFKYNVCVLKNSFCLLSRSAKNTIMFCTCPQY